MSAADLFVNIESAAPGSFHGRPLGRISVKAYDVMIAAGLFDLDDRFELIEGMLVAKLTKGWRHCRASERTWRAIQASLPPGWHVEIEKPVRITPRDSMPEPDVLVVRGDVDDYDGSDLGPPDLGLVVEIADTTLAADRALAATYIEGGIPTYWLINVPDRLVKVYSRGSTHPAVVPETGSLNLHLEGTTVGQIAVSRLLPRG